MSSGAEERARTPTPSHALWLRSTCGRPWVMRDVGRRHALASPRASIATWRRARPHIATSSPRTYSPRTRFAILCAGFVWFVDELKRRAGEESSCPAVAGDGRAKETWDMGPRGDLGQRSAIQDESSRADQPGRANGTTPGQGQREGPWAAFRAPTCWPTAGSCCLSKWLP